MIGDGEEILKSTTLCRNVQVLLSKIHSTYALHEITKAMP